jgi:hypothetical protein
MSGLTPNIEKLVDTLTFVRPLSIGQGNPRLTGAYKLRADHYCFNCSNLYALEYDEQGTCFRWSGPGDRVKFHFRLSASLAWRLTLRFIATLDPQNPDGTRLFVDGAPVELLRGGSPGMWWLKSQNFRVKGLMTNEFLFHVPGSSFADQDKPEMQDNRRLGIAWHDLLLEPVFL